MRRQAHGAAGIHAAEGADCTLPGQHGPPTFFVRRQVLRGKAQGQGGVAVDAHACRQPTRVEEGAAHRIQADTRISIYRSHRQPNCSQTLPTHSQAHPAAGPPPSQ